MSFVLKMADYQLGNNRLLVTIRLSVQSLKYLYIPLYFYIAFNHPKVYSILICIELIL